MSDLTEKIALSANIESMESVGRPTVMTPETLNKLDYAFSLGCTDEEACLYADISPKTLYNYQTDNPEYLQRKKILKQNPVLKARTNIVLKLNEGDVDTSKWYMERKKKDEFSPKQETELSGTLPVQMVIHKLNDNQSGQANIHGGTGQEV